MSVKWSILYNKTHGLRNMDKMTKIGDEKESYIVLSHEERKKMLSVMKFHDLNVIDHLIVRAVAAVVSFKATPFLTNILQF